MRQLLLFAVLVATMASCSPRLTPFTANLRNEYQWTEKDLKKIQFYLSEDIVLWRELSDNGNVKIDDGAIRIRDGRKVEEIRFPKRTPGVFIIEPKSNNFGIAFENGNKKYLMFGPSKKRADFVLLAADWKKDRGRISYGDRIYYTTDESAYARLLVDLRAAKKLNVKRKTVEGRKIKS